MNQFDRSLADFKKTIGDALCGTNTEETSKHDVEVMYEFVLIFHHEDGDIPYSLQSKRQIFLDKDFDEIMQSIGLDAEITSQECFTLHQVERIKHIVK